jgi:type I restriction enzyme S subunit
MPEDRAPTTLSRYCDANVQSLGRETPSDFRFRYVDLSSVNQGKVDWQKTRVLTYANSPSRARRVVKPGDVLFSTVRPGLMGHGMVREASDPPVIGSTGFAVLSPKGGADGRFLFHALFLDDFKRQVARFEVGSNYPAINESDLLRVKLGALDGPSQCVIADILDALDDAILKTDALIEKLLALRVGLTEDLLTFGIGTDGRPRSNVDVDETILGPVPASWSRDSLGLIAETITSGSRGWAKYYSDTGAKFLRIGNLTRQHINLRLDDLVYVTPPKGQEGSRTAVQNNDLLISITADLGIIGSVPPDLGEAYVNQHISLVRLKESTVNPRWPAHFLSSRRSQIMFEKLNDQGAKAGINLPAVAKIQIPLPPREEQDAIVERLDAADEEVARYRIERDKLTALREGLRDDLLTGRQPVVAIREAAE